MEDFSKWLDDTLKSREVLGNHDLEQFDSEALAFFANFINEGVQQIAGVNPNYFTDLDLENLQALRVMIYNAKNVVSKRELTEKN